MKVSVQSPRQNGKAYSAANAAIARYHLGRSEWFCLHCVNDGTAMAASLVHL